MHNPTTAQNRATPTAAGRSSPHPAETHPPAARGEAKAGEAKPGPDFLALLHEALTEPGRAAACYRLFHRYSLGNALWLAQQLAERGEPLAPVASFKRWQELGRNVRKGSKALMLCMPVTVKPKAQERKPDEAQDDAQGVRRFFVVRRNWFALQQTEGADVADLAAQAPADWNPERALQTLGIARVPFEHYDGNCQGYAQPSVQRLAINPLAAHPLKTLCHELAHCLLHTEAAMISDGLDLDRSAEEVEAESVAYLCSAALGLGALDTSRGYIQGWLGSADPEAFTAAHARRILLAADRILKAGRAADTPEAGA